VLAHGLERKGVIGMSLTQLSKKQLIPQCALGCIFLLISGCKTLSLPAIDPSGNRIFAPQTTTINPIHGGPSDGYPSQQPAYQTPPDPPECLNGKTGSDRKLCKGCLAGKGCLAKKKAAEEIRGRCGQLLLTPTRLVAPVGGEVILLAGVCGKDEYLVTDEPIEWMLAPKSVGEIVQVGDDSKREIRSTWKRDNSPKVEKLGIDFARGRTSREAGVITRGTATPQDDLPIRKGQTWVSLTSPNEGVSKVTAFAPDSDIWDKRRQTATIYWIDASWEFPSPQTAENGKSIRLTTKVLRADGYVPAEGWTVRYRTLNPEFAKFLRKNGPQDATIDEDKLVVDQNGLAETDIVNGSDPNNPNSSPFGNALVEIEIIKPAQGSEMPELQIARGTTLVTWRAASVVLEVNGPNIGTPGQVLPYFARVCNVGDLVAENQVLKVNVPNGMQIAGQPSVATSPPFANNLLQWNIGPIPPRECFEVSFNLVPSAPMDARVLISATSAQPKTIDTLIQNSQLELRFDPVPNQTQVEVGSEASFEVLIANTGNQVVNNVLVTLTSDPGLPHIRGDNTSVQNIDFISPGQTRKLNASFIVQREGELFVKASLQAQGAVLANQTASVRGIAAVPKRPSIGLRIDSASARDSIPVNSPLQLSWSVANTGPVPLRNVVVSMQYDPNFELTNASQGVELGQANQVARWRIQDLPVGGAAQGFGAQFVARSPASLAKILLQVDTAEQLTERQTFEISIGNGNPAAGNPGPGTSDVMPNSNLGNRSNGFGMKLPPIQSANEQEKQLGLTISPVSNAIKLGDIGTYEIRIESLRNKPHQQVALKLQLPPNVTLAAIRAKELRSKVENGDRTILFEPIQYFRANDVFSVVVDLRLIHADKGDLIANVSSNGQPNPTIADLSIQAPP
jgi:uncharacterized repeat protein (TIGR01451 family)